MYGASKSSHNLFKEEQMNCKNPYCPVKYEPLKEPCKSCKDRIQEMDLPKGFEDLFGGLKK